MSEEKKELNNNECCEGKKKLSLKDLDQVWGGEDDFDTVITTASEPDTSIGFC